VVYASITILIANFFLTLVMGKLVGLFMRVRNLTKSFGAQLVLDSVGFKIENGESVAIIGRSGSGKSVLLKHLIGLLQPDSGEVLIDGENIVPMNERQLLRVRGNSACCSRARRCLIPMTVAKTWLWVAPTMKFDRGGNRATRAGALEMVDLPGTENKQPPNCRAACASGWDWPRQSFRTADRAL